MPCRRNRGIIQGIKERKRVINLDKLKHLFSKRKIKTVANNFGYLSLLQVSGYFFPFITMPYLARVIGTAGFGKLALASAIICWRQIVADWGHLHSYKGRGPEQGRHV